MGRGFPSSASGATHEAILWGETDSPDAKSHLGEIARPEAGDQISD
jgi:hypothetical protein